MVLLRDVSWLHVGQVLSDVASFNYNILQYFYVAALCVSNRGDAIDEWAMLLC